MKEEDGLSRVLIILSSILPPIGFWLYFKFKNKNKNKKKSKKALASGLIGIVMGTIMGGFVMPYLISLIRDLF